MRKNKRKGMWFNLGTFNEKKFKGRTYITLHKKSQITPRCKVLFRRFKYVWLEVNYGIRGVHNEGTYNNLKDLKQALSVFTEKSLLDDVYDGVKYENTI